MKNLTLEKIAHACGGTIHMDPDAGRGQTEEASGVVIDSRLVTPGAVFIATKGERVDGHSFIPQVFEKGAMAVICEELPQVMPGPCIRVEDSFQALKDLAAFYREGLDIPVIGITGSVGKTSTKEFVAGVLSAKYKVLKTQGNFNNEVGLPLTVLQIRQDHEVAVLEMGISQFGEMHRLSRIAKPDICVLTNIGQCHLEFLKDRDGVLQAKSEIFDYWNPDGFVCINGDDDKLITLKEKLGEKVISFGRDCGHDFYAAKEESLGLFGSRICIEGRIQMEGVEVPLPGEHMVLNALAATAVAHRMGMKEEEIREGLHKVERVAGRSNIIRLKKGVLIDDCYNANPVSMKAALELLWQADGRKVAVLGDMFELGEEERKLHRQVGAYAAEGKTDILIAVGELSEEMQKGAEEVKDSGTRILYVKEKEDLYSLLKETLVPGDTILLKASHGMKFSEVVDWIKKNEEMSWR